MKHSKWLWKTLTGWKMLGQTLHEIVHSACQVCPPITSWKILSPYSHYWRAHWYPSPPPLLPGGAAATTGTVRQLDTPISSPWLPVDLIPFVVVLLVIVPSLWLLISLFFSVPFPLRIFVGQRLGVLLDSWGVDLSTSGKSLIRCQAAERIWVFILYDGQVSE